jgi:spermidine/putrescine transport system ATP-binding protein
VTVVVRPEHAVLTTDESAASLTGTVDNIVYFGTDTRYHLRLADGVGVRHPGPEPARRRDRPESGERAGAVIGDAVAQILKD